MQRDKTSGNLIKMTPPILMYSSDPNPVEVIIATTFPMHHTSWGTTSVTFKFATKYYGDGRDPLDPIKYNYPHATVCSAMYVKYIHVIIFLPCLC